MKRTFVAALTFAAFLMLAETACRTQSRKTTADEANFDVILQSYGDSKIMVIKTVREVTGLGLKDAKDLVEAAPKVVKKGVSKEEAETIRKKLEDAGATVEVKKAT